MARVSMHSGAPVAIDPYDTNEKKIAELRKCREAKLYVRPDFIDALVEAYDKTLQATAGLQEAYENERAKVAELTVPGPTGNPQ